MALTINTNLGSLIVQKNLKSATNALNESIERMTTGYKINSASDDAAGYSVATKMDTKLGSISVAQDNVSIGTSLLTTAEDTYDVVLTHLQRIRDLCEEAANGTYGSDAIAAINLEITARKEEIDRLAGVTDFNGISLLSGSHTCKIQCGIDGTANSQIDISDIFANATTASSGLDIASVTASSSGNLAAIDKAITTVSTRQSKIGAYQNRLESAADALEVQYSNVTSSLSTVRDADVAKESTAYIQAQILQQASASLLSTANQSTSIALNLM